MGNPYTPQLNGIVERKNRSIIETIRTLITDGGVVIKFWQYAAKTAEYLLNRLPTKTNKEKKSPYEIVCKKVPDLSNLHPFGCIVMAYRNKEIRSILAATKRLRGIAKIGPIADIGILLGFTETGYLIYDIETEKT